MPPILLLNCSYWVSLETWWEFLSVFYSYYFQRKLRPVSDVTAATHNGCKSLWAYCLLDWAFGSSPKNNRPSAIGHTWRFHLTLLQMNGELVCSDDGC